MKNYININLSFKENQSRGQGPVGNDNSLIRIRNQVAKQIELDCFENRYRAFANDICMIIAEVMFFPSSFKVRIDGQSLLAGTVAEVYKLLTHEHIALVIENFEKIAYRIKYKKTYLRTALYNSLFEYEAHYTNEVRSENEND